MLVASSVSPPMLFTLWEDDTLSRSSVANPVQPVSLRQLRPPEVYFPARDCSQSRMGLSPGKRIGTLKMARLVLWVLFCRPERGTLKRSPGFFARAFPVSMEVHSLANNTNLKSNQYSRAMQTEGLAMGPAL